MSSSTTSSEVSTTASPAALAPAAAIGDAPSSVVGVSAGLSAGPVAPVPAPALVAPAGVSAATTPTIPAAASVGLSAAPAAPAVLTNGLPAADSDSEDGTSEDGASEDGAGTKLEAALDEFRAAKEVLEELKDQRDCLVDREVELQRMMQEHPEDGDLQRDSRTELERTSGQLIHLRQMIDEQAGHTEMTKWAVEDAGGEVSDDDIDVAMYNE